MCMNFSASYTVHIQKYMSVYEYDLLEFLYVVQVYDVQKYELALFRWAYCCLFIYIKKVTPGRRACPFDSILDRWLAKFRHYFWRVWQCLENFSAFPSVLDERKIENYCVSKEFFSLAIANQENLGPAPGYTILHGGHLHTDLRTQH